MSLCPCVQIDEKKGQFTCYIFFTVVKAKVRNYVRKKAWNISSTTCTILLEKLVRTSYSFVQNCHLYSASKSSPETSHAIHFFSHKFFFAFSLYGRLTTLPRVSQESLSLRYASIYCPHPSSYLLSAVCHFCQRHRYVVAECFFFAVHDFSFLKFSRTQNVQEFIMQYDEALETIGIRVLWD